MARKSNFCVSTTRENQEWIRDEAKRTGKTQSELFATVLDSYRLRAALIPAIRAIIREELDREKP